ncbi:FAD-dependent oxidoreductase [Natronoflexus pectinivorans]|uniref:Heterodisulfide reductase subunit A n=1 Tax=Natronoflexus pectinivorans TaxID=682526 RepID=A0A4R2GFW4_9BACT|nr:FAD-dependent oxidoreductase [Natronoflexus pectinivorans]TCO07110.1 heterodisulfide reductase subunit A [Natronoflexus pectinivorans]
MQQPTVSIIGAGPAGLNAAISLAKMEIRVNLFEKQVKPGGQLSHWHTLFPDMYDAKTLLKSTINEISHPHIKLYTTVNIRQIKRQNNQWIISSDGNQEFISDAVIITSGFNLFDATKKEEYGYGIYPQVITSLELEQMFNGRREWPFSKDIEAPKAGFVHCVGSRDTKCGNNWCSKVCCVKAVKQAIEFKKQFPKAEVSCFYMDLRMFGKGYEELYMKAQVDFNIQFIRGRLSEASPSNGNKVHVKAEDTLMNRPLKQNLDMLVLMVGMTPAIWLNQHAERIDFEKPKFKQGFINPVENYQSTIYQNTPGVFAAGTCKGPASLIDVIQDAKATAFEVFAYLKKEKQNVEILEKTT